MARLNAAERVRLRDDLVDAEGLRLKPYRDSVGKLTIGIGRNLDDVGISQDEARYLCANDMSKAEADVMRDIPAYDSLTPPRQRVLVEMAFNLGIAGLKKFRLMLAALDAQDYAAAAAQMRGSLWARQVGRRAERLARVMETGRDN